MIALRLSKGLLLLGSILCLQSCAAMFTGTKSTVLVDSEPRGIPFSAGKVSGVTPQSVQISKKTKEITFELAGSGPVTQPLERRFQGGMLLLDILFTPGYGVVGCLVDGMTAAWYKHEPTFFFDAAKAMSGPSPAVAPTETIASASP